MGGLAVVFFIGLYIAIAYWMFKRFDGSNFRWLVVALAVLIPSGDAIVGRLYLKNLCAVEGGLKISRVVEQVDGFMGDGSHSDYWVKEHGYQFAEDRPVNGMTTRYSQQNGQIVQEVKVPPKSKYRLSLLNFGETKHVYMRQQYVLKAINNGEVLATDTQIYFNGGWAEKFLAAFSDAGGGSVARCGNSQLNYEKLVVTVLKH